MSVALIGNLVLDRWLHRVPPRRLMLLSATAMPLLYPLWCTVPGVAMRFVVDVPLTLAWSTIWPTARAESMRATDRPGAVTAVNSLTGLLLPVTLAVGVLAQAIGLTPVLLSLRMLGTAAMLWIAWRWLPR
jgi:fucose permease